MKKFDKNWPLFKDFNYIFRYYGLTTFKWENSNFFIRDSKGNILYSFSPQYLYKGKLIVLKTKEYINGFILEDCAYRPKNCVELLFHFCRRMHIIEELYNA